MHRFRVLVIAIPLSCVQLATGCKNADPPKTVASAPTNSRPVAWQVPAENSARGYLSSNVCQRCHPKSHESWHRSFHRTMTQPANAVSIRAPFDGRQLTRAGVTCTVERRGEEFWVTAPDPDIEFQLSKQGNPPEASPPPLVERPIRLVTGSHHLQIYWVPSQRGNELRIFPWVYSLDEQRWMPYEDSFVMPPSYRRMRVNWNANCIACHTLEGKPNYDAEARQFVSEVVEFGISCEACHGPGEQHVQWREDPRNAEEKGNDPIIHPARLPAKVSAQICGQCHSDFERGEDYYIHGPRYRAGGNLDEAQRTIDFEARRDPRHAFHDSHWADGTGRVGGREYLAMIASPCFQAGELSCITCHSMHQSDPDQQLAELARGNTACLQCHQDIGEKLEAHTHHPAESSGSECYNCHMPRTSFALFRAMRSHRIDNPNATLSLETGRPNACNLCHLDKSLSWTAERLHAWYGITPPELGQEAANVAASLEWLLKGNAVQRVVTAWHYGWPDAHQAAGTDWEAPALAQLLNDSYSAVRLVAGRSLKSLPHMSALEYDFLGSQTSRLESKQWVMKRWRAESRGSTSEPALRLLKDDGDFDERTVQRMLRQQDQSPVTLTE